MPDIYNIAANQQLAKPVSAFLEGRESAVRIRNNTAVAERVEMSNDQFRQEAPLRDAQQKAGIAGAEQEELASCILAGADKVGAMGKIFADVKDEASLEAARDAMREYDPETAAKMPRLMEGSFDETIAAIDKGRGTQNVYQKAAEDIIRLDGLLADPELSDEDRAFYGKEKELRASQAQFDLEKEARIVRKADDASAKSRAETRKLNTEADSEQAGGKDKKGWEFKATDSSTIDRQTVQAFGGLYNEITGEVNFTDKALQGKARKASARAQKIYKDNKGVIPHGVAVQMALVDEGAINPDDPKVGDFYYGADGVSYRITKVDPDGDHDLEPIE